MLYIVATPIGNLSDMTLRGIETLKACSLIIAENPSHTKHLLDHFSITGKKMVQFAEHNEAIVIEKLVAELKNIDGCLVSDAGTPGISDPGFRLVRECIKQNITVIPIPGANAATTALSSSGLPTDRYIFFGFLQKTEPKLLEALSLAQKSEATAIIYESPQRIIKSVSTIAKKFPNAQVVVARELTKLHEEFIRGTATEALTQLMAKTSIKGEIVLLVSFK
jgi:16S rRNA (cytidine1402-2'-O)-methyltransferase